MSSEDLLFDSAVVAPIATEERAAPSLLERVYSELRKYRWPLSAVAGILIIALTGAELHKSLNDVHFHEIRHQLRHMSISAMFLALAFTGFSFLSLAGQEFLALASIGNRLPFKRAALGSFIAQSISHSTGFNLLIGGGIRARYYLGLGLTFRDVAATQLAFSGSFGLAMGILLGSAMLFDTSMFARSFHMSPALVTLLGGLTIATSVGFLTISVYRRQISVLGHIFAVPEARTLFGQTFFSALDLIFVTTALYVLLPSDLNVSFVALLGIVLLAISVGVASNVPGGLGVFESVILAFLAPHGHHLAATVGALLVFRVIYYFLPLILGAGFIAVNEAIQQRRTVLKIARGMGNLAAPLTPTVFGMLVYACGIILLSSGAIPGMTHRIANIGAAAPLSIIEASHFVASILGAVLLVLARELTRRKAAAWTITMAVLVLGAVASIMKGLDGEEATVLFLVLALLYPCRSQFYRKSKLGADPFSLTWLASFALTIAGIVWLLYFAYRHTQYDTSLWWQFTLEGSASRSMRATVAASVMLFLLSFWSLFRTPRTKLLAASKEDFDTARVVVNKSSQASAGLALTSGKSYFFSKERDAMLMYGVSGDSWIVMGNPIGPKERWSNLVWDFRSLADRSGARTVFYEVDAEALPILLEIGLQLVKLGEQARIDLKKFSLIGKIRAPQRNAQSRAIREGITFSILAAGAANTVIDQIKLVSDSWLQARNAKEKGFSLGSFEPQYLEEFPIAIAKFNGRIVAFANLWLSSDKSECSVDLMRFEQSAPKVTMDFLFTEMLLWAQAEGYAWFDLGMAPLAGLPTHRLAPLWSKLGRLAVRYGGHFYSFAGLREFKDKFDPTWRDRYLAYPSGTLPRVLNDTVSLIAGRGIVPKVEH